MAEVLLDGAEIPLRQLEELDTAGVTEGVWVELSFLKTRSVAIVLRLAA